MIHVGVAPRTYQSSRTATHMKNLNPIYKENHPFQVNWPITGMTEHAQVKLEFWDYDKMSSDEFLGEVSFPLPREHGEVVMELPLKSNCVKGAGIAKGSVQVKFRFEE